MLRRTVTITMDAGKGNGTTEFEYSMPGAFDPLSLKPVDGFVTIVSDVDGAGIFPAGRVVGIDCTIPEEEEDA